MAESLQTAEEHRLELRHLRPEDYTDLKVVMDHIYSGSLGGALSEDRFQAQLRRFQ